MKENHQRWLHDFQLNKRKDKLPLTVLDKTGRITSAVLEGIRKSTEYMLPLRGLLNFKG